MARPKITDPAIAARIAALVVSEDLTLLDSRSSPKRGEESPQASARARSKGAA